MVREFRVCERARVLARKAGDFGKGEGGWRAGGRAFEALGGGRGGEGGRRGVARGEGGG